MLLTSKVYLRLNTFYNLRHIYLICIALLSFSTVAQNSGCVTFNAGTQRVTSTSQALNTIGSKDFTFEAWLSGETSIYSTHPTIFSNKNAQQAGTIFFFFDDGSGGPKMLAVQLYGVNYSIPNNGTFNGEILDGECHHVAISRVDSLLTFYVDGSSIGTTLIEGNPSVTAFHDIWIGQDPLINNTFSGTISVLKIWGAGLTQPELNVSKDCPSENGTDILAYWKFDEGGGPTTLETISDTPSHFGSHAVTEQYNPSWGTTCCACDGSSYDVPKPQLELPNVVTANGDLTNDVFTPVVAAGIEKLHCVILNRWGNVMYESDEIAINWNPLAVTEGVYYYLIDYTDNQDNEETVHGFFYVEK